MFSHVVNWLCLVACALYIPAMRHRKVTLVQGDYLLWGGVTLVGVSFVLPQWEWWFLLPAMTLLIWGCVSIRAHWRRQRLLPVKEPAPPPQEGVWPPPPNVPPGH